MKRTLTQIISWLALAGVIVPPVLFLAGHLTLDTVKQWMLAATIVWTVATPFWMKETA
jgi:high-affinity nickel permease